MPHEANVIDYKKLPKKLVTALQHEVLALRQQTKVGSFRSTAYVEPLDSLGVPEGEHRILVASWNQPGTDGVKNGTGALDHALRVDLLLAALTATAASTGWAPERKGSVLITRPGPLEQTEDDLAWLRAWPIACDIADHGRGPVWAVTRSGWLDVGENSTVLLPRHRLRRPPPRTGRRLPETPNRPAEPSGSR